MKKIISTFLCVTFLSVPAFANQVDTVLTDGFEPIKAKVINDTPSEFTINVKFLTNTFANTDAPIFAVYTSSSEPEKCADFRNLDLSYQKPSKYERRFNLANNPEVIDAINQHQCVVIPNIPAK